LIFLLIELDFVALNSQLVPVQNFDDHIINSQLSYKNKQGMSFHLFDLIPDRVMFTYVGKRFSEKELGVCLFLFLQYRHVLVR
jgi:hypothetical protein